MSEFGEIPDGVGLKLPALDEMTPSEKADVVDKQTAYLERLFQANVIPADSLLLGVRNAQTEVGITTTITDENIDKVKGKYMNDLSPQADPFGGIFQGNEENAEGSEAQQQETQQTSGEN
jgi:hypothetical protein